MYKVYLAKSVLQNLYEKEAPSMIIKSNLRLRSDEQWSKKADKVFDNNELTDEDAQEESGKVPYILRKKRYDLDGRVIPEDFEDINV
jgi:uncharacterized protein YgiM (DUF1202 family)